jgi:hypothetical protein
MNSIPTSFSLTQDLAPVFSQFNTQADAALASIFVIQDLHHKSAKTRDAVERSNYAVVLRDHGWAIETDISIIKRHVEMLMMRLFRRGLMMWMVWQREVVRKSG